MDAWRRGFHAFFIVGRLKDGGDEVGAIEDEVGVFKCDRRDMREGGDFRDKRGDVWFCNRED